MLEDIEAVVKGGGVVWFRLMPNGNILCVITEGDEQAGTNRQVDVEGPTVSSALTSAITAARARTSQEANAHLP